MNFEPRIFPDKGVRVENPISGALKLSGVVGAFAGVVTFGLLKGIDDARPAEALGLGGDLEWGLVIGALVAGIMFVSTLRRLDRHNS